MNYYMISHDNQNNGDGLRVVLWLSGCSHHCYNCQNSQTWEPDGGIIFDADAKRELFNELEKDYISGLTLTGGDPLHENNLEDILSLTEEIRVSLPEKTIWLYTGYMWEEIMNDCAVYDDFHNKYRRKILSIVDILVDGRYIDSQRDITLKWRGSKNQRVIDIKKTLNYGKVILFCH